MGYKRVGAGDILPAPTINRDEGGEVLAIKIWIPGVIILAGILVTVGVVASKSATSHASEHVNSIGNLEESQIDGHITEGVAFIGIALDPVPGDELAEAGVSGNANLLSVIANLKLKMGIDCVTDEQLATLTEVSHYVAEVTNMPPVGSQPYVGASAFANKGGLHAAAVAKVEHSYQHVPPQNLGNEKRVPISKLSGRGNILWKVEELGMDIDLSKA